MIGPYKPPRTGCFEYLANLFGFWIVGLVVTTLYPSERLHHTRQEDHRR